MQAPTSNQYQLNVKIGHHSPPSSTRSPNTTHENLSSTFASNSSRKTSCSEASDIIDADYIDKNIPKMELLKINYVSRSRNSLATSTPEEHDIVQLRAKKRVHPKQQLYQRSHSDGVLKVSELAKLSGCNNTEIHSDSNSSSKLSSIMQFKAAAAAAVPKVQSVTPSSHQINPLKYTVYKKHNAPDPTKKSEKLQYTNDDAIFKANKKKYSMFDSRKRNAIDNIQFYFDSKSYERHVDNKMYGVLMKNVCNNNNGNAGNDGTPHHHRSQSNTLDSKASVKRLAPAGPPSSIENKSNSWNFVKATKSLLNNSNIARMSGSKYTKNVPSSASSKKMSRDSSLVDLSRIGQLFKENTRRASADDLLDGVRAPVSSAHTPKYRNERSDSMDNKTAGSSKKIKKLSIDFENKCLCDYKPKQFRGPTERKTSAPAQIISAQNASRNNDSSFPRFRRKLEFPSASIDSLATASDSPPALPPKSIKRLSKCSSVDYDDDMSQRSGRSEFYLLDKARSKSIASIEHGVPLFGHFQSNNCGGSGNTCGYKNCTFVNCPMSSITAALSNVNRESNDKICLKTTINTHGDRFEKNRVEANKVKAHNNNNISITKIDTISNKSKLYLKTKDFADEDDDLLKQFEMNANGDGIQSIALNNLKNLKNTTNLQVNGHSMCNGGTTIPIKFTPNQQNLNNSMKCKSVEKLDFNSTSTIEDKKFNNAPPSTSPSESKAMTFNKTDEENKVKIFIRNPPPVMQCERSAASIKKRSSASSSSCSSASSPAYESSSSAESTSDYYDSVPAEDEIDYQTRDEISKTEVPEIQRKCNITDFGIVPTTKLLTPTTNTTVAKQAVTAAATFNDLSTNTTTSNLKSLFPSRLGCDGAIFWNDCFYYDEHACCSCKNAGDYDKVNNGDRVKNGEFCSCKNRFSEKANGDIDDDEDIDDGYDEAKQVEIFFFSFFDQKQMLFLA